MGAGSSGLYDYAPVASYSVDTSGNHGNDDETDVDGDKLDDHVLILLVMP